jgi:uroporphyrinogen-III synthase
VLSNDPTLVLTRPQAQSQRFLEACQDQLGRPIDAIISPIIEIFRVGDHVDLSQFGAIILTSANGLLGIDTMQSPKGVSAWCVGPQTAEAARDAGFEVVSAGGSAEDLRRVLAKAAPSEHLVHLRGLHGTGDLAAELSKEGLNVTAQIVYEQRPCALNAEAKARLANGPAVLPIFSPRSARALRDAVTEIASTVHPISISAAVAKAWDPSGKSTCIASSPDGAAMVAAVVKELSADSSC